MPQAVSEFIAHTCDTIKAAAARGTALRIEGGGSKAFYGRTRTGEVLRTGAYQGVVDYAPSELVITARAGTSLRDIEAALAEQGQMLPFEPPHFGPAATLGGAIACGLSGPRRVAAGAVRDAVLGCELINGFGEHLAFGGQVMKNVAGYDVSRLMVGALGTLGVITQVSVKVVPRPVAESTLVFEYDAGSAIEAMNRFAGQPLPISATYHDGERLYVRLSGTSKGVAAAVARLGGEASADAGFWARLREQELPLFSAAPVLWRLSVPSASAPLGLPGTSLMEWHGGLRWLASDAPASRVRDAAAAIGGHALRFRGHDGDDVFHPLDGAKFALHRALKRAFDPAGVLNPGGLYADF